MKKKSGPVPNLKGGVGSEGGEEKAGFFDGLAGDTLPEAGVDFDLRGVEVNKGLEALAAPDVIGLVVGDDPAVLFPEDKVDDAGEDFKLIQG